MTNPSYAVLILNFNCASFTLKAIESVLKYSTTERYSIQVVDNHSTEIDREMLYARRDPRVFVLPLPENRGFAVGCNTAARMAFDRERPDYFVIMNPDVELVHRGTVESLIERIERSSEGIVGAQPLILNYRQPGKATSQICIRRVPDYWDLVITESIILRFLFRRRFHNYTMADRIPYQGLVSFDVPSGAFFVINAQDFLEIGGFDERTFLYAEELILGKKLRDRSKRFVLDPSVEVRHYQGASTRFERGFPRRVMYRHRILSNLLYVREHLGVGRLKAHGLRVVMEAGYAVRVAAWLATSIAALIQASRGHPEVAGRNNCEP